MVNLPNALALLRFVLVPFLALQLLRGAYGVVCVLLVVSALADLGGAMLGDALSSFVNRRLGAPPSTRYTGLDQIPEALLPLLLLHSNLDLGWRQIAGLRLAFFPLEIALARSAVPSRARGLGSPGPQKDECSSRAARRAAFAKLTKAIASDRPGAAASMNSAFILGAAMPSSVNRTKAASSAIL